MRDPERLLVITLSNIGDLVLTTPVFEALARHYPGVPIDIFGDARSAALLAAAPYAGETFLYDKRGGWPARFALLRALRRRRYLVVVDLRGPLVGRLLRAERSLCKPRRRRLDQHAVDEHFAALAPLLADNTPPPCRLYLSSVDIEAARKLLSTLPGARWLAVAPGANWPGKKWSREGYRELLLHAAQCFDGAIILGSPQDVADAQAIASQDLPCLNTAGTTDLRTAAALLARAAAFVGNDSGLGHIAAAMGTPSLTLFGPGNPQRYGPRGPHARIVLAPQNDLTLLSVVHVWSALQPLLARAPGSR